MTKRLKRSLILSALYTLIVMVVLYVLHDGTPAESLQWVFILAPVQFIGVFLLNYFDLQKNADVKEED
ncbi:hypothetical protein EOL70_12895 [Leucothrix sargassi]|nr:hypothetical protein EOL70_12895 [Leucothrix sargassi]